MDLGIGKAMTAAHSRRERTGADEHTAVYEEARAALLLGQLVYDRRAELGLTQAELADRAGMTQPQLSRLESGGATPTVSLLACLAAALDVELGIREPANHAASRPQTL
jgi:ribosome-binding protein aMBF1 (putative translation factor)